MTGGTDMARLIDAQDAFNVLTDYYHHSTHVQHLALQEALNKVPTVDAEPVIYSSSMPQERMNCLRAARRSGTVFIVQPTAWM